MTMAICPRRVLQLAPGCTWRINIQNSSPVAEVSLLLLLGVMSSPGDNIMLMRGGAAIDRLPLCSVLVVTYHREK